MKKQQYTQPTVRFHTVKPHVMHIASVEDFKDKTSETIGDEGED